MKTYIKIIFIISIVFNFSYSDTLENIQELSIKEDAKSQYELGKIYRKNGEYKKAFENFQKSANQGYDRAEFILGYMYSEGEGIEKDYQKSIEWYEKSANQNNSNAQSNLATMYRNGKGVEKNIQKAIQWYEKSANQGNPYAYYNLGTIYLNDKEVIKDYKKAVELFKKSINQKDKLQQEYIDKLCKLAPEACDGYFYNPSFSCDKVKKNSPEYIICTDKNLSKQDKALNDLYLHLLNITPKEKIETIKIRQKDWIKNRQQQCLTWACMKKAYIDREKELKSLFFEKNISENFYYDNKPIHPGCLYQLLPELNGDNIVKKIDLINCAESNKYYTKIDTKAIDNKEYLGALVDNEETYTQYHLIKYLGYGLYEFNIISYPAKGGTIVSKDKVVVKLNREIFYEYISIGENNKDTIDKKNYLELQLLLNTIDNNDTQLNKKYEDTKQLIINQYKNMDNNLK